MISLLGSISLIGWILLIVLLLIIIGFIVAVVILVPIKIWFKASTNGAKISMVKLAGLKQRNVDISQIVDNYIIIKKAGLSIDIDEMQTHMVAGGNISNVVNALIAAENAKVDLSVDMAKAIDLSGKDACEVVKNCINPKVIESSEVSAIAKDGIELKVKVKATIKAVISKFLGSAGEDTILARITEGIVGGVGSLGSHQEILRNPDLISKYLLTKNLDKDTAYEVLSVEVSSIDFGRNIGIQLKLDEIEIDKKLSGIKAEEIRAKSILQEQEMRIKTEEMKMEKMKAEAEIPKMIAKAFEEGKMSLMDYYKMQNIIADTNMRKAWTSTNNDEDNR